jgi:hypothetical protein
MADKKGLRAVGLVFAALTAAVLLTAAVTVQAQITGGAGADSPMAATLPGTLAR